MRKLGLLAVLMIAAGCATAPVNLDESRRVVGTERDVRLDAEIFGEGLAQSVAVPVKYDITNNRSTAIAVADMVSETSYDPETRTVTLGIGSEVPGARLVPRLIAIGPGEKKSFSTVARVNIPAPDTAPTLRRLPNAIRLKMNFLGDTTPFVKLVEMTTKGVEDPQLAEEIFPKWLEKNETVYTNTLPMRWSADPGDAGASAVRRPRRY